MLSCVKSHALIKASFHPNLEEKLSHWFLALLVSDIITGVKAMLFIVFKAHKHHF